MRIILQNRASNYYACQFPPKGFGDSHIHLQKNTAFPLTDTAIIKLSESFIMTEVYQHRNMQ